VSSVVGAPDVTSGWRRGLRSGTGPGAARRAIIRWAVRLLRREWRQQLLVILLITVAVGTAVFTASAAYSAAPSRDAEFGTASHRLQLRAADPGSLQPEIAAAQAWFGIVEVIGHRQVPVPGSTQTVDVRAQDAEGPYGSPMLRLRSGRYPATSNEVALTDGAAALFDVSIGDQVVLGRDEPAVVVGTVENPAALDDEFALVTPSAAAASDAVTLLVRATDERVSSFSLPDGAGGGQIDARGRSEGTTAAVLVLVVATVALLLVSLVAAAGFVTLAQRRLRQLGMLAAVGATQRQLRLVMVANGAAVGLIAGIAGTAFALTAWVVGAPFFETAAGHRIARSDVPWWLVAAGLALAVLTATVAAWWPARSVARVPIVDALSARPPRPRAAHRSLVVAAVLLGLGIAGIALGNDPVHDQTRPLFLIVGVVATAAALLFMATPAIGAVATLAGRLPATIRLAVRDLARYQARSGAALGAISLGVAIAVSVVVVAAATADRADEGNLSDAQLIARVGAPLDAGDVVIPKRTSAELDRLEAVIEQIGSEVGSSSIVPLDVAVDPTVNEGRNNEPTGSPAIQGRRISETTLRDSGVMFVATPSLLAHLGVDPSTVAASTLLLTTQLEDAYLVGNIPHSPYRDHPLPADAVQHVDLPGYRSAPHALITMAGLESAALVPMRAGWLIDTSSPVDDAQLSRARQAAADAGLTIESRNPRHGLTTVREAASAAGILLALGILAMTVGLIRGEAARDLRTLAATGASSRSRRALTASTAGVLAAIGVVVGTVGAYAALIAGYWPDTVRLGNIPLRELATIVVGLPVLAVVTGWALAGREPPAGTHASIE
jgi:putative ABC transport system permease protein